MKVGARGVRPCEACEKVEMQTLCRYITATLPLHYRYITVEMHTQSWAACNGNVTVM